MTRPGLPRVYSMAAVSLLAALMCGCSTTSRQGIPLVVAHPVPPCGQRSTLCGIPFRPIGGPALHAGYLDRSSGLLIKIDWSHAFQGQEEGRCFVEYQARMTLRNTRDTESGADLSGLTVQRGRFPRERVDGPDTFLNSINPHQSVSFLVDLPVHVGTGLVILQWADRWDKWNSAMPHVIARYRTGAFHSLCH